MTEIKEPPPGLRSLAERLRWARKDLRGLSQPALAKAAGVSSGMIGMLETGERLNPGALRLDGIAAALGVSAAWLATGKGEWPPARRDAQLLVEEVELLLHWRQLPESDRREFARALAELANRYKHYDQARAALQLNDLSKALLDAKAELKQSAASGGEKQPLSPAQRAAILPGEDAREPDSESHRAPGETNRGRA